MSALFPLAMRGAVTSRRGVRLVGPVDLRLEGEGTCVIIGPNGSGKTSLLRLMSGAARLSRGQITWATDPDTVKRNQAFVFQRPVMLRRSVMENLIYPLVTRGTHRSEARRVASDWAARVGLSDVLDKPATQLSGGEQQKLALTRAMVTNPALVFLDEPCASLDGASTREIETLLQEIRSAGTRLILSTHDMGQARRLADEVVFLHHGEVLEHSTAAAFFDAPQTAQARAFLHGDIVE